MFERILISVLIPALLMLAFPQTDGQWRPSAERNDYGDGGSFWRDLGLWGQAVLLGTQTGENELFVFARTAPDEVAPGETFTVTDEVRAKVDLELAAIAASSRSTLARTSSVTVNVSPGATSSGAVRAKTNSSFSPVWVPSKTAWPHSPRSRQKLPPSP